MTRVRSAKSQKVSHDRRDLTRMLRARIVRGEFRPGASLPTRTELARELRCSSHTIQAAVDVLTAEGFVESATRWGTRVVAHPPHTHTFAVIATEAHDGGQRISRTGFARILIETARTTDPGSGRRFKLYEGVDDQTLDDAYHRLRGDLQNHCLAGVIATTTSHTRNLISESNVPWVCAAESPAPPATVLGFSSVEWASSAAAEMVRRGRRRAAYFFNANTALGRGEVLAGAVRAAGLDLPRARCQASHPDTPAWARRAAELLLSSPRSKRPDALIVGDDVLVDHVLAGVIDAGLRVPEDLDVCVMANFPSPAPPLFPILRLGWDLRLYLLTAVDLIERRRAGKAVGAHISMPPVFAHDIAEVSQVHDAHS